MSSIGYMKTSRAMSELNWKRICCAVDLSDPSRAALEMAAEIARRFDADLAIFHAAPMPGMTLPTGDTLVSQQMIDANEAETDKLLEVWQRKAEQLGAPRVSTARAIGFVPEEIVRFASDGKFDLLVLGTHGRTALKHVLLGSVAEKVVRKAPCAVLTIRPRD
jgi:nucleotide-binding universal stress UspA family protein